MRTLKYLIPFLLLTLVMACQERQRPAYAPTFTRADSLTDLYLKLQDSLHQTWNVMIYDDNQKLQLMQELLTVLRTAEPSETERYAALGKRLDQLTRMRFTQKSMANADVIEEYDFATNSLIAELIGDAEASKSFAKNPVLQQLVDEILMADQRMANYRYAYDSIAWSINLFMEQNGKYLTESDEKINLEKKPRFQMAAEQEF